MKRLMPVIANKKGRAIRFSESKVRPMGRMAAGVKAIRLDKTDSNVVIGMVCADRDDENISILVVSENPIRVPSFHRRSQNSSGLDLDVLDLMALRRAHGPRAHAGGQRVQGPASLQPQRDRSAVGVAHRRRRRVGQPRRDRQPGAGVGVDECSHHRRTPL